MITAQDKERSADSMICYCNNLTREDLLRHHRRCGSLAKVQDETKAGKACGGCRVILQSLFGELPQEINAVDNGGVAGAIDEVATEAVGIKDGSGEVILADIFNSSFGTKDLGMTVAIPRLVKNRPADKRDNGEDKNTGEADGGKPTVKV